MLRKLGKKLTHNFGLKVLAAFFAVAMWLVVLNIDDPIKSKSITTSVTLENEEYITSMGKCYELLGGSNSNTVSFRFTAQRSIVEKTYASDFSAVADLQKIEYDENTGVYRVPVTVTPLRNVNSINITTTKQIYLELTLEDYISVQLPIKPNTSGTVADGCALGDVELASTNVIKVSGPASIVSTIDSATATINVEGMSTDITDSVVPTLYDTDGNVVDTTKLKMSLQTVAISAQILGTKDVALSLQTMGKVAEGYKVTEITSNPTTIRVKGEPKILNTFDTVKIPEEVLDLTEVSEDIEKTVDITSYLPEGVSVVISSEAKIDVKVTVEPIETRTYEISKKRISLNGLAEKYEAEIEADMMEVSITATVDDLDALEETKLKGIIDATDLTAGTHIVDVDFGLDEELYEVSTVRVTVVVTRTEIGAETENTTNGETSNGETVSSETTESGTTGSAETTENTNSSGSVTNE